MNREIAKLHQRIETQQKLIDSKRPDPEKQEKISQLKVENNSNNDLIKKTLEEGAPVRIQLHDENAKNVKFSKLNHDLHDRWQKHLDDEEHKASLVQKNEQAHVSIEQLKANIEKLKRIRDKYANNDFDKELFKINELTKNLMQNNHLARHTILLDEESLATGKLLKSLLDECQNLLVRNNVISDKLPITLGIQKDDYHQQILNQYMKQESFLVDDEAVEFSKASVAYFFRIFIVEVKVNNINDKMSKIMEEYLETRDKFKQNHQIMGNLKPEDLTPELLEAAHRFNDEIRQKNAFFRAKAKEYTEVITFQKIGVDRFQERIRTQAAHQIKERHKVADILTKNGINRVAKNNQTLKEFFVEVERLLKVKWLQHHINEFTDFKKKVLGLNDENNALTGNFHVIKLALEKAKLNQGGVQQADIQKISKFIQGLNVYLDSTYADHESLVDIERRIKELTLEYKATIEQICEDAKEILKNKFSQKSIQIQDLKQKDEDLMLFLDTKKSELYNIKSNVDDNDKVMQDKFMTYETQLAEANQDEEFANENTRQIQSKIDRYQKQFLKMIPIQLKDITQCDDIVESLNKLDLHIKFTEQMIEDAYKKIKDFDKAFKECEDQIRNKRIKDAEKALGVAFGSLDKMNKILEKLRGDVDKVEKDQKDLINNKFEDQEKQRDTSQFAREIESKIDMLNEYVQKRDNFKHSLEGLKSDYENKLKLRETPTGLEFKKIQQDSDRVNSAILTQISVLEGPVTEEINQLKDSNQKLQEKYKYKKQKHGQCMGLRNTKTGEFKTWLEKLKDYESRQDTLEKALKDIGYTPEYAKLYVSLVNRTAKNKASTLDLDNQVQNNQKILLVEATDLDYLPLKIVKNLRLDEIYKLLEQMRVSFDGFDDVLKEVEDELKRLEKDVADFMNKLRGSQYNDVFNKLRKLENNLEKLNKKIKETQDEMSTFKDELNAVTTEIKNKDSIKQRLGDLGQELERITIERDEVVRRLDILKAKFNKLDKQNLSVQDCEAIMTESDQLDHTVNLEFDNTVTVQEKLRQLMLEFREANKAEVERQKLIQKAKDGIKQNREQLKNLKQKLQDILDKANDFEILYRAELNSDDYAYRKDEVEKDLADIKNIKDDTQKYMQKVDQMMSSLSDYTDSQIEQIQNHDELKAIIEKNDKISSEIRNLAKIVDGIARDLEARRERTQDAEIRKNCSKHISDIDKMAGVLEKQVEMLDKFEEHVLSSIQDEQEQNKGKALPPQLSALQDTLDAIKKQLGDFKGKYNGVKAEIYSLQKEIKDKDLEHTEPLPNMAAYIERMGKIANLIKDLKGESDDLGKKIEQNAGLLGSMDIDKKLQRLLDLLIRAQKIKDTLDAIQRIIDLTDSYDGYTSGDEDTGFFTHMNGDSKELKEELLKELQNFQDLEKQIRQVIEELEFVKQKNNGAVDQGTQDKINNTVDKIKGLYRKGTSNKEEIDANAINNKGKMSGHELEGKIQRRKNELDHIDQVLNNNLESIQGLKEKVDTEIEACGSDATYQKFVNDLKVKLDELDKLTVPINTAAKNYKNIAFDNDQLYSEVEKINDAQDIKVDKRLDYFDAHLIIKKRLNHVKEQNPYDQFGRKIAQLENEINDILSKKPKKAAYKSVKGDEIDQMLAEMLNKTGESVDLKRLGGGFYMFGDKKIFCKIMNGNLVVRVGGGYVSIEEFIKVYAKKQTRGKTGEEIEVMIGEDSTPKTGKNKKAANDGFKDAKPKGVIGMGAVLNSLK
eukprot:403373507